jgi:hypothetical protein
MRYDDIDPMDIDPDTGRPYSNYSSPALDTSEHDREMDTDPSPWAKWPAEMRKKVVAQALILRKVDLTLRSTFIHYGTNGGSCGRCHMTWLGGEENEAHADGCIVAETRSAIEDSE